MRPLDSNRTARTTPSRRSNTRDDSGFAVIWTLGLTLAMVGLVGMVVDGGTLLRARSDAHSSAASAARYGAQQLDVPAMLDDDGELDESRVQLQRERAERTARQYMRFKGYTDDEVVVGFDDPTGGAGPPDRVIVQVTDEVQLQILQVAGQSSLPVVMEATARAAET